jgi:hypothetical protein
MFFNGFAYTALLSFLSRWEHGPRRRLARSTALAPARSLARDENPASF